MRGDKEKGGKKKNTTHRYEYKPIQTKKAKAKRKETKRKSEEKNGRITQIEENEDHMKNKNKSKNKSKNESLVAYEAKMIFLLTRE